MRRRKGGKGEGLCCACAAVPADSAPPPIAPQLLGVLAPPLASAKDKVTEPAARAASSAEQRSARCRHLRR